MNNRQPTERGTSGDAGILNVIFHGSFTSVEGNDCIQVFMPKNEDHVCRAGNWLGETELRPGVYELKGVESGSARFPDSRNIILTRSNLSRRVKPYAILIFPRPQSIASLGIAEVPRQFFDNPDGLELTDKEHVATLQVFTYRFNNDSELRLEKRPNGQGHQGSPGHAWEPVFVNDHINLHLFAAEDHYEGVHAGHTADAFSECSALMGSKLRLMQSYAVAAKPRADELPAGVCLEETEDLASRMKRMARLGRAMAQHSESGSASSTEPR